MSATTESTWDTAIKILADRERFPNIPADLVKHAELSFLKGCQTRLTQELLQEPENTSKSIDQMFQQGSQLTRTNPDELLANTDFDYHDISSTRIEAAFAEIRTVRFLHRQGFENISLLKSKSTKRADILANRGDEKYAVEVANSTYSAKGRFTSQQLKHWLLGKYHGDDNKAAQLTASAIEYGCHRRLFVAIVDTATAVHLQEYTAFCEAAKSAWTEAGRDQKLHICFATQYEHCFFPELP